ncbi:thiol reductant ABC exporter subunit CydD [Oecophyllibacter saccharovorans]|uniref:thiol reductant ABC exporter subunit CydD n=1 Tax=Oecophyllibacter saccharovorans TaxID=2558360 RepID=UPI00116E7A6C|nr:thiol reductant ABC exporter subunit CydD [Oecophyllibacter saccharovorans]TPW35153.1 thiol reductant ABC exporter subunit CydD [Oecophyllibacter saccharovorans]
MPSSVLSTPSGGPVARKAADRNDGSPLPRGLGKLGALARRAAGLLGLAVGLGSFSAVLLITQMGLLARLVTDLAFRHQPVMQETRLICALAACALLRALVQTAADSASDQAALKVTSSLRLELLGHLFRVGPVGLAGQDSGRMATALSEGVEALRPYLARYIPRAAAMVVIPLLILAVVFRLDWISFLTLAITGPLIPFFMALVGYGAQAVMRKKWNELLLLGSAFLDMLQGLTTLRLFGEAQEGAALVARLAERHRSTTMEVMRVAFLTTAVLEFFSSLSIAAVAVFFGVRLLKASVPFETAFFVLLLAPEYFMPLRAFSASYHARQNAASAFTPLAEMAQLPEVRALEGPLTSQTNTLPVPGLEAVLMHNVSAGYAELVPQEGTMLSVPGPDVLKSVTACFPAASLTVVTGRSGAGKTTLFRLLMGLMPPRTGSMEGQIDKGENNEPGTVALSRIPVAWVPQSPYLMADSIAANLRLADPQASLASLKSVCAEAGALAFIEALPDGFDTVLGERGAPLSAGQIRRLALARAFLHAPQLLLFDEPTADLDAENARQVCEAVKHAAHAPASPRIVIAISHRDDILQLADQVLQLRDGHLRKNDRVDKRTTEGGKA